MNKGFDYLLIYDPKTSVREEEDGDRERLTRKGHRGRMKDKRTG